LTTCEASKTKLFLVSCCDEFNKGYIGQQFSPVGNHPAALK